MFTHNEQLDVAWAMINHGGHFISFLGRALQHADPHNAFKIYETWPEDWKKYKAIAEKTK